MADNPFNGDQGVGVDPGAAAYWNYLRSGGNTFNATTQDVNSADNAFVTTFTNLMGRAPTEAETNQFFQTDYLKYGSQNQDPFSTAQNYVSNAFGPQIAQYNQQQQTSQLGTDQSLIQNLITQTMGNTASSLSDPNSQIYQQLAGSMNNMGITPSSGAFQAGAGSTIANSGLNAANNALQQIEIPGVQQIGQTGNNPYQTAISAPSGTPYLQGLQDFQMESQLGQLLAQMSQPSGIQKDIGMAGSAGQALGGLGTGIGGLSAATWICTAMVQCNALLPFEVKKLHDHLYRAFWKRPLKFISYLLFGRFLVYLANKSGTNWYLWKTEFYDDVMAESDPVRAVDLYAQTFWKLYANVKMNLDGRKLHAA